MIARSVFEFQRTHFLDSKAKEITGIQNLMMAKHKMKFYCQDFINMIKDKKSTFNEEFIS